MKPLKKIALIILVISSLNCFSQNSFRKIYNVEIMKIATVKGKLEVIRININEKGVAKRENFDYESLDLNTFTISINNLTQKAEKIDGDNDKRTGIQMPKAQNIYVSVIYQDDYDNEPKLKNKTCYRYKEIELPVELRDYEFLKYFSDFDTAKIKKLLK